MASNNINHSRRTFLKTSGLLAAVAAAANARTIPKKTNFPFVDGLCISILDKPEDIRASGLTGIIVDVSDGELTTLSNGVKAYQRTFAACLRSIVTMRQKLRQTPEAFLATGGSQIKEAFRSEKTAVFLQIQGGGEAVGEDISRIDAFSELGLRVFQITHHNNNPLGGGAMEKIPSGLTKIGFEAVERLNALGIIPDLSHASDLTALDVLKTSKKPVIISHGGARALVNNARDAPDDVIRGAANSGGVMGIFMMSFWLTSDPVPTVESLIKQIKHVIKVGGIDAVGISNDFPLAGEENLTKANNNNSEAVKAYYPWWDSVAKSGVLGFDNRPLHVAIPQLNNIRRMYIIEEALEKNGFKQNEIEKIMGGNWIRVLTQ